MSTYEDDGVVELGETEQQVIVGVTILLVFAAMVKEVCAPEIAFLFALLLVTMLGILTLKEAVAGFSNLSVVTIGTLYLVISAVEKSYVVDHMARAAFGSSPNPKIGASRMYAAMFALSSVFNNTPLVAVMIPVVRDWGRVRGIALSQLLMPMSFAVLAGGLLTMIGTSTNLTVQGLVKDDRNFQFSFFAPVYTGLPCGVVLLVYMVIAAPYLLPSHSGLIRELRDNAKDLILELEVLDSSVYKGREIGDVVNSLGISFSDVVKIRRSLAVKHTVVQSTKPKESTTAEPLDADNIELTERSGSQKYEIILGAEPIEHHSNEHHAIADAAYVHRTEGAWGEVKHRTASAESDHMLEVDMYRDILNPTAFEVIQEGDSK